MMKTDSGVLLIESNANNHLIPHIGHIFAVGPECSEHIKPGLRVFWNQFANLEVMIKGEVYMIIEEREVYGVLPDSAYARIDGLSDKEVGTKERVQRQEGFIDRKFAADQEEKDTIDFLKNKGK
jgi:co-chaperonin GroES (HSP10)